MAAASELPDILHTRVGALVRLAPRASLNSGELLEAFAISVDQCVAARQSKVIVDLSNVALVNSAGLEALMDAQDKLLRQGGWLKYTQASSLIQKVFEICGIAGYIGCADATRESKEEQATDHHGAGHRRLGEILIEQGHLTEAQVVEATELQERSGMRIGRIVVEKGWLTERQVIGALSVQLSIPAIKLEPGAYDPAVLGLLEYKVAKRLSVLPLFRLRGVLYVATAMPQSVPSLQEVEEHTGCTVRPVLAARGDIDQLIAQNTSEIVDDEDLLADVDDDFEVVDNAVSDDYSAIDEVAAGSPVINLVNSIIQHAVRDGASDIHIEPCQKRARIRFRIDGILYEFKTVRMQLHPSLVSRLKVMANLDIAERRLPQDGRIQVQTHGRSVDLRFSSLPGMFGEKIVLRILDKKNAILELDRLGMTPDNLQCFKHLLTRSHGLVLVTGPTGSGKTTSLYAALSFLNSIEKNIVTIEDPVEYQLDIINQNQVRNSIGLTFSKVLKHILRQDPDIVMVGEIRESETARIAVQAALTGHLVLSTLHTNDSVGAVTRLIDMGVEPYLLSSALIGVIAQRLVRAVCPACKVTSLAPPEIVTRYGWDDGPAVHLAKGRGCSECYDSGYRGRVSIHEVLAVDEELQKLVMGGPTRDQLSAYMDRRGIRRLEDDGLDRVRATQTTIEEVSRMVAI